MLAAAGVVFDVQPAEVDEAAIKRDARSEGLRAEDAALRLADHKAAAVSRREPDAMVIGADQILVCDGTWYDKPDDAAVARAQLLALRGRSHVLATAVVCHEGGRQVWHDVAAPRLAMRNFSDAFLDCYLAAEAGTLTSTVGCYRLEGRGVAIVRLDRRRLSRHSRSAAAAPAVVPPRPVHHPRVDGGVSAVAASNSLTARVAIRGPAWSKAWMSRG